jgi:uncharacterized protein (TIGR02147 family)
LEAFGSTIVSTLQYRIAVSLKRPHRVHSRQPGGGAVAFLIIATVPPGQRSCAKETDISPAAKKTERNKALDTLFERDDFRGFLRDYFEEERRLRPRFSLRAFSAKAGFQSMGFMSLVVSGARNLGEESIASICHVLGLVDAPANFFTALVRYNQARTADERLRHLEVLKELRKARAFARAGAHQFPYWEEWHHVAIRELVVHSNWGGDYSRLGRLLRPRIGAEKARKSVERLCELGLVRRDEKGGWQQSDPVVSAEGAPPVLLREFKKEMVLRGLEAMDILPPGKRHFSTVTLAMSHESLRRFARRIDELRADMLRAATDETPEAIFQANFQIFPLSENLVDEHREPEC